MKVRFTPGGREQFLSAIAYIRRDNAKAAASFRRKVEKVLRRLEKFPESGRVIPEFSYLPSREVIVPPYRFFYGARGGTVWVVAAWHVAQMPRSPRLKED